MWKEGFGKAGAENIKFSWLDHVSFYTLTSVTQQDDELLLVSLGANDPNFNLRRDAGLIIRKKNVQQASYINVIETHGSYSTVTEAAINASSSIITVEKVYEDENYIGVSIKNKNGTSFLFVFATANNSVSEKHTLEIKGTTYSWVGTYFSKVIK